MKTWLLFLLLVSNVSWAATNKTDCLASDKAIIESPTFLHELYPEGLKILRYECLNLPFAPDSQSFVLSLVISLKRGTESHLVWFNRVTFKSAASALAKTTDPTGIDAFPVFVNGQMHMAFAIPKVEHDRIGVYVNVQMSPSVSRLIRYDLDVKNKTLLESPNRLWQIDAGIVPKIYEDSAIWRALIVRRSVEL